MTLLIIYSADSKKQDLQICITADLMTYCKVKLFLYIYIYILQHFVTTARLKGWMLSNLATQMRIENSYPYREKKKVLVKKLFFLAGRVCMNFFSKPSV